MEHFTAATRLINEVQESLFSRLESTRDTGNIQAIEGAIDERIRQIEAILDKLEISMNKAAPGQRSSLKFKLDQLKQEHKQILSAFRTIHQRRLTREREQQEREELLTRRFTTNDSARAGAASETGINMGAEQYFEDERTKLHGFNRQVDDMLSMGSAVMGSLRDQRSNLSNSWGRIKEIGATLGLSNSVMRLIEKRAYADKFILFGGMLLLTLAMFLIWKYLS